MALTQVRGSGISNMVISDAGIITKALQPAFLVTTGTQNNIAVGSDVTVVWATEIFDQNADFASNVFTAPVTGKYQLNVSWYINSIDSASDYYHLRLVTTNRIYDAVFDPGVLASDPVYWHNSLSVLADMDASETAYVTVKQATGTQQTDIGPSSFSGYLVA